MPREKAISETVDAIDTKIIKPTALKDLNQLLETQRQIAMIQGISKMDMKIFFALVRWPILGEYIFSV
jgi:hypothetical protein